MPVKPHIRTLRSKKLHAGHIKLINEAIRHNAKGGEKNVHITYKKENGEQSQRKVKPLAVKGKSLFVAHCHERNAIRSFRVERISMVKQAFWDGFEKRAEDKSNDVSWWEGQKGVTRASRRGESGADLILADKDLVKDRIHQGGRGALKGLQIGGLGGAAIGAGGMLGHALATGKQGKGKRALIGAGIGSLIGGLGGAEVGFTSGVNKSNKEHLKRKGIESSWGGFKNKFSPEAKAKYIDAYRKKD